MYIYEKFRVNSRELRVYSREFRVNSRLFAKNIFFPYENELNGLSYFSIYQFNFSYAQKHKVWIALRWQWWQLIFSVSKKPAFNQLTYRVKLGSGCSF